MTFFNKLKALFSSEEAVQEPQVPVAYAAPIFLRKGKWVMHENQLGIITDTSEANVITIALVNDKRETAGYKKVPLGGVRLARLLEIPELARPDKDTGELLGYF